MDLEVRLTEQYRIQPTVGNGGGNGWDFQGRASDLRTIISPIDRTGGDFSISMDTADLTNVFTANMFAHGDNGEFAGFPEQKRVRKQLRFTGKLYEWREH